MAYFSFQALGPQRPATRARCSTRRTRRVRASHFAYATSTAVDRRLPSLARRRVRDAAYDGAALRGAAARPIATSSCVPGCERLCQVRARSKEARAQRAAHRGTAIDLYACRTWPASDETPLSPPAPTRYPPPRRAPGRAPAMTRPSTSKSPSVESFSLDMFGLGRGARRPHPHDAKVVHGPQGLSGTVGGVAGVFLGHGGAGDGAEFGGTHGVPRRPVGVSARDGVRNPKTSAGSNE